MRKNKSEIGRLEEQLYGLKVKMSESTDQLEEANSSLAILNDNNISLNKKLNNLSDEFKEK